MKSYLYSSSFRGPLLNWSQTDDIKVTRTSEFALARVLHDLFNMGLKDWLKTQLSIEIKRNMFDVIELKPSYLSEIYTSIGKKFNGKQAEFLKYSSQVDVPSLVKARVSLYRGDLHEAKLELRDSEKESLSSIENIEIGMEVARALCFEGDWQKCIEKVEQLIGLHPEPITLMALFQISSVANFELGRFTEAISDLTKLESMDSNFRCSLLGVYGMVLRAKINLRGTQDEVEWNLYFKALWLSIKESGRLNLDTALCLSRVQVEACRYFRNDHVPWALLSLGLARLTGETLYEALSLLECYYSSSNISNSINSDVNIFAEKYRRFKILKVEIESTPQKRCQSAQLIVDSLNSLKEIPCVGLDDSMALSFIRTTPKVMILPSLESWIEFESRQVRFSDRTSQLFHAARLIGNKGIKKEQLFLKLWGTQKYSPHLHDSNISSLLNRIRKEFSVSVSLCKGYIRFNNCLVVT